MSKTWFLTRSSDEDTNCPANNRYGNYTCCPTGDDSTDGCTHKSIINISFFSKSGQSNIKVKKPRKELT